jgi:hypothetical protein
VLGAALKRHCKCSSATDYNGASGGEALAATLLEWAGDPDHLWKRRAAAVAFVKLSPAAFGLQQSLRQVCDRALNGPVGQERFVQLGVGWALRGLSEHDEPAAMAFLKKRHTDISREGLRCEDSSTPTRCAQWRAGARDVRAPLLASTAAPHTAPSLV